MAGTLIADEIKSGTNAPPTIKRSDGAVVGEVCRSRVNFNGTGVVAVRDGFNVSSLTDNGTGDYSVNYSTPLADNFVQMWHATSATTNCIAVGGGTVPGAAGRCVFANGSIAALDVEYVYHAAFGD